MTKDEVRKTYVEATARKLRAQAESREAIAEIRAAIAEIRAANGPDTVPMTPVDLREDTEQAIALSGLAADDPEVERLRAAVGLAITITEVEAATPSPSEIGRVL